MIEEKEVARIAHLARLHLTPDELKSFATQLSSVLKHFNEIANIDTKGIEPLVTPTEVVQVLREDQYQASLGTEEGLSNAPEKSGNLFKVPPVV